MYNLSGFDIGEKIQIARKSRKMTLEEFGGLIGKSKSTIYKYEEGTILPDFLTLLEICNHLNISINDLCEFSIDEDKNKNINPFDTQKVYLYYIGYKGKLIGSKIDIEISNKVIQVKLENSYKDKDKKLFVNKYIGILESDKSVAFMNFKNFAEVTEKFEKIQIIVDLKHFVGDMYMGSINATTDANTPTARKCIISKEKIQDRDGLNEIYNKLLISKEELKEIKDRNYWNMPVNSLEEN